MGINQRYLKAIATHLQVKVEQITKAEEWAKVIFVVLSGRGGRFVSKKILPGYVAPAPTGAEQKIAELQEENRKKDEEIQHLKNKLQAARIIAKQATLRAREAEERANLLFGYDINPKDFKRRAKDNELNPFDELFLENFSLKMHLLDKEFNGNMQPILEFLDGIGKTYVEDGLYDEFCKRNPKWAERLTRYSIQKQMTNS